MPQRALDGEQPAARVLRAQRFGQFAARHPPHVQFEQCRVVRRRGDREAAAPRAGQHDVEVLSRLKGERLRRRQPQVNGLHVVRQALRALDAAGKPLDEHLLGRLRREDLDGNVAARVRPAQQDKPFGRLGLGDAERPAAGIEHFPVEQSRPAGSAGSALAAVRQIEPRVERRIEQRLAGRDPVAAVQIR